MDGNLWLVCRTCGSHFTQMTTQAELNAAPLLETSSWCVHFYFHSCVYFFHIRWTFLMYFHVLPDLRVILEVLWRANKHSK